ncbi:MAG: GNAT family N-acetyltransferase [Planctomycetes bacterium]|nr:GNAT family N-acetyltransferase [Planctomycetota bacterium]
MSAAVLPELEPLPWDSSHFGFGVARCTYARPRSGQLAELRTRMRAASLRLCYLFAEAAEGPDSDLDPQAPLVDLKTTFVRALTGLGPAAAEPALRPLRGTALTPALLALTIASGWSSRFRRDPCLPAAKADALYEIWIRRSLAGEIADQVFAWCDNGSDQPLGFVTIALREDMGSIGLIAVAPAARGRGIGASLVDAALRHASAKGAQRLEVVTQGANQEACRLYQRCGFTLAQRSRVFHVWADLEAAATSP